MSEIRLCPQHVCTGCLACKQVCAKGAIYITEVNGFNYPEINTSLCVDCGLCTKICPVLQEKQFSEHKSNYSSTCYAIWNKDVDERMSSSSGGVFSVLARYTLKVGGIVYGAAWDEKMQLRHVGIDDVCDLDSLRRSKYVQSNTDGVYMDVRRQLKTGRQVLFSGTPCQIAGLLSFLGHKDFPNLLTVGVVCHGVPSQRSFDKYLREIEENDRIVVYDCNFRSKNRGWRCGLNLLIFGKNYRNKDVTISKVASDNSYFNAFLKQFFLRESCYNCPFKGDDHESEADIMMSDFWNYWSVAPLKDVDFGKGVSAIVVHTDRGRQYLRECTESFVIQSRPYSEYASNSGLRRARKPYNNDDAFEFLQTHTWEETQSKFFPLSIRERLPIYSRLLLGENKSILIKKVFKKILHR